MKLIQFFLQVVSVNLKMDQMTGRSRGFAFVVFQDVETLSKVDFYYEICRIGDLRPTHLLESHVSGQILKKVKTDEGEVRADQFQINYVKVYITS